MPTTLRKVSCWPAKDASGMSSAVADERTANEAFGSLADRRANSSRTPLLELGRERRVLDPAADLGAGLGQRAHVVGVERLQARGDALGQAAELQELAERVRRGGEAAGHAHARGGQLADHFAEAGVLAADRRRRRSSSALRTGRPVGRPVRGWTWESSLMMKNRAPRRAFDPGDAPRRLSDSDLSVEAGHGNGTCGKIYGSVDRDSTEDLPIIG